MPVERREGRGGRPVGRGLAGARQHLGCVTAHHLAVVVVHAERVDRRRDGLEVARADGGFESRGGGGIRLAEVLDDVGRVRAAEDRVEEPAVELPVDATRGVDVGRVGLVERIGDGEVQRDAEVQRRVTRPQLAHGLTVAEQQVVRGQHALGGAVVTRRVDARRIREERRAPRLVERGPDLHPIAERVVHVERVLGEEVRGLAVRPSASLLQRLRKVPVVQRQPRQDVGIQQLVRQPLVEVDALRVDRTAVGAHPRPRGREAVRLEPHRLHERHVVAVQVVVVARDVAVVGVDDGARHPGVRVPDRVASSVLVCGAFDLVGGGGGSEEEV